MNTKSILAGLAILLLARQDVTAVLTALENASDHLPVVADYTTAAAICANPPPADLNGDCIVDQQDILIILEQWMDCGLVPQSACP